MLRRVLFQIHWALGITAGVLLAIIGVTGAMMSFEDEIMAVLSRNVATVVERSQPRLSVPQLVTRFYETHPASTTLAALTIEGDPSRLPQAKYTVGVYDERALILRYLDIYDGKEVGETAGRAFFDKVREIHRWLLLPDRGMGRLDMGLGRWVTMITAVSLIFFALSGLYLRWPRQPLAWRSWFKLDFRMTGRNFLRSLHAVVGGWVLIFYLFSAFTGLWWSFGDLKSWYRDAVSTILTGHEFTAGDGDGGVTVPHDLTKAWAGFESIKLGDYERVIIEIREQAAPVRFRVLPKNALHDRAWDTIKVDNRTGQVLSRELYGQRNGKPVALGDSIISNMLALHRGTYFGLPGRIALMIASAAMPLFTITGLLLYLDRRKKKKALRAVDAGDVLTSGDGSFLVVYATQTRTAERLARQTAAAFTLAGQPVDVVSVDMLDAAVLARAKTALFIASTYGEGEPPDAARSFARRHLDTPLKLESLSYAVLALGDREYTQFCSFGHRIDGWLQAGGARRLFDTIEVNGEEEASIESWRRGIATLGAASDAIKTDAVVYERWRLAERKLLNPGSPGAPAFHVALEPVENAATWQAGDIAIILPGAQATDTVTGTPLPPREYSIASTPAMQRIEFIVRQVQKENGQLGLGSGWLTRHLAVGAEVDLRLQANPAFRAPDDFRPIILIGNGTGLAGLLAHIRQRAGRSAAPAWLLFGERSRVHDRFHGEELDAHLAAGTLARWRGWIAPSRVIMAAAMFRIWLQAVATRSAVGSRRVLRSMSAVVSKAWRRLLISHCAIFSVPIGSMN